MLVAMTEDAMGKQLTNNVDLSDKARNEDHFYTQQQTLMTCAHPEIGPAIRRACPIQPWKLGLRLMSEK